MDEPARLDPIHDRDSHLIAGAELATRFARFPELDIETRGPVPSYEHYYNPRHFLLRANKTGEAPRTTPKVKPAPAPPPTGVPRALLPVARRMPPGARRRLRRALGRTR
jgi:hypothetical protein